MGNNFNMDFLINLLNQLKSKQVNGPNLVYLRINVFPRNKNQNFLIEKEISY